MQVTKIAVEKEESEATRLKEQTQAIADSAQKELDEALPALNAAVAALRQLKRLQIVEVKNFQRPPAGVLLTMKAVCIMFGVEPYMVPSPRAGLHRTADDWISRLPCCVCIAMCVDRVDVYADSACGHVCHGCRIAMARRLQPQS